VEIWEYLKRNWIWIALGLILSLLIAHIYLRYSENFYQAEAKILLKEDATKGSSELSLITGKMGKDTKPNISDQIEIMKSRRLIQKEGEKLKLNHRDVTDGRVKKGESFRENYFLTVSVLSKEYGGVGFGVNFLSQNQIEILQSGRVTKTSF